MKKRFLALVLAVVMTIAYMPAMAFADEPPAEGGEQPISEETQPESIDDIIKDGQLDLVLKLKQFLKNVDLENISSQLDTIKDQADELYSALSSILDLTNAIVYLEDEKVAEEAFVGTIQIFTDKLDREVTLINHFVQWLETADIDPGDKKELKESITAYQEAVENLITVVNEYVDGHFYEVNGNYEKTKIELISEIKDQLNVFGNAFLNLKECISDTVKESADDISEMMSELTEYLKEQTFVLAINAAASAPEVAIAALNAFNEIGKAVVALRAIGEDLSEAAAPVVDDAITAALSAFNVLGDTLKGFVGNMIADAVAQLNNTPGSKEAQTIVDEAKSIQKTVEKQITAVNENKTEQLNKINTYITQLENAGKIVTVKPKVKSAKKKGTTVTFKWKAVKSGKITYYQVRYKIKGKKAIIKKIKKFKANAKYLSCKIKGVKKGKKCSVMVRGVYKMSNGKLFYTQWSETVTVKAK